MVDTKESESYSKKENISDVYADILSKIESDLHQSELKRQKAELEKRQGLLQRQRVTAASLPIYMHVPPQFSPDVSASKRLVHMYKLDDPSSKVIDIVGDSVNNDDVARAFAKGEFKKSEKLRMNRAANGVEDIPHVPEMIEHSCGEIWRKLEEVMKREMSKQRRKGQSQRCDSENNQQEMMSKVDNLENIMNHPQVLVRRYDNCVASTLCPKPMHQLEICWKSCIQYVSTNSREMEDPKTELLSCFALQCNRFKADVERCQGVAVMKFLSAATPEEDKK